LNDDGSNGLQTLEPLGSEFPIAWIESSSREEIRSGEHKKDDDLLFMSAWNHIKGQDTHSDIRSNEIVGIEWRDQGPPSAKEDEENAEDQSVKRTKPLQMRLVGVASVVPSLVHLPQRLLGRGDVELHIALPCHDLFEPSVLVRMHC
jgi:hypothetical protein